jgi:Cu(I)/Ag(I) efflux system membrane fusion protein
VKRIRQLLGIGTVLACFGVAHVADGQAQRTPLYYQEPDGKPFYAAGPKQTTDGRAYVPVFEDRSMAPPPKAADRRILYYRNPMGLPDTSPVPKKDSMGMDYLPVYADEAADPGGTVRIAPGRLQTLGVRTEEVAMRPALSRTVRATGTLQFDERHLATVTTKAGGWIEHLAVAATGDPVRRGQVLAEIYAPDLVVAEEEYLVAARMGGGMTHGDPGTLVAASLQRLRALDVPEDEIVRLRKSGKAQRLIAVRAPADGVVIEKPVQEGMRIEPGQPLYKTADLAEMWLIAEVQERDLGLIQPGQSATAEFVAFPGRSFEGTVEFVYPALAAETRTARVRIVIPNPDQALRAAMYASVSIAAPAASGPVLAIPSSAVIDSGTRQVVLVDRGEGRFEPRPVRLGAHGNDWVEVTEGLKAGDKVVTSANFLIDAESNLRTALQGFAGSETGGGKP